MNDWQSDVREFHRASCPEQVGGMPAIPDDPIVALRIGLIGEEFRELREAFAGRDLVEAADALFDLLYVTIGTLEACGIESADLWNEGHMSNMSKVGPDGRVSRRADGKVEKGPNYRPPDFARVLREQGWDGVGAEPDMEEYL